MHHKRKSRMAMVSEIYPVVEYKNPIHNLLQCTREKYLSLYSCRLMIATLIICHARNLHLVVLVFFGMVKTAYCDDKENIVDKYVCQ